MPDLSPAKILVILVVAAILLGPDKLPQISHQMGTWWRKFREFNEKMDADIRQNIPNLPSTKDIARYARSPVALLDQLAKPKSDGQENADPPEIKSDVEPAEDVGVVQDPKDESRSGPKIEVQLPRTSLPKGFAGSGDFGDPSMN